MSGLFTEQISRKPDNYPWAAEFCRSMHNGHWTSDEFNFKSDIHDFKTSLTDPQRNMVIKTLSAIGQIECSVKTFWGKLGDTFKIPSIIDLGYVMANIEVIHGAAYEKLLTVLDLNGVFEENLKLEVIQNRVTYLRKYNHKFYKDQRKQFIYALILFTLFVENVSLFSQFYIINWLGRYKNVLKDTNQQTRYTRLEEQIHSLVGIKIINTLRKEYAELFDEELEEKVIHEAEEAFKSESKIIDWIVGDYNEQGLNAEVLKEFIKKRINESLKQIKFKKVFKLDESKLVDTQWFDEEVLGNNSTDFFHSKPVEYSKNSQSFSEADLF